MWSFKGEDCTQVAVLLGYCPTVLLCYCATELLSYTHTKGHGCGRGLQVQRGYRVWGTLPIRRSECPEWGPFDQGVSARLGRSDGAARLLCY
jgi:hypothetical protein